MDLAAAFSGAVEAHQAGRLDEAEAAYREILAASPSHPDVLHLLGVIHHQRGKGNEALACLDRAARALPDRPDIASNRANALFRLGRKDEAIAEYRRALTVAPDFVDALANLAIALRDAGRIDEAASAVERAMALAPARVELAIYLAAIRKDQGRAAEALPALERLVAARPQAVDGLTALGAAYQDTGRAEEAITLLERARSIAPGNATVLNTLGAALLLAERTVDALAALEAASTADPERAGTLANLAVAHRRLGRIGAAEAAARRATELAPNDPIAQVNLGDALMGKGDVPAALIAFRRAAALAPHDPLPAGNVVFAMDYDEMATPETALAARRDFARRFCDPLTEAAPPHLLDGDPDRVLRIGYVSANFARGSVGTLVVPIILGHDPRAVEAYCYSDTAREDDLTARLREITRFRRIIGLSDAALADQIRRDRIDILVDMAGHMMGSRLLAFARKPAPIQVSGWGNAIGTGLAAMDFLTADAVVAPPGDERFYSERLWRLPSWLYFGPPDYAPEVGPPPMVKRGAPTFGCLNRPVKTSDGALVAWGRVLAALPPARLILKAKGFEDSAPRERILAALVRTGAKHEQIEFRGGSSQRDHLATYGDIDIVLDTFPHTGGATAFEGLWMGVPQLALLGRGIAGRGTASLLTTLGLADWIAPDVEAYIARAVAAAREAARLAELRVTLRNRLATSSLTDLPAYVRAVEAGYRAMWREGIARGYDGGESVP
ncbi:MAG: tetratricopeptide repeat protein [Alphaproteobacteria bacterium]|nr:tetratricopeptide repeat protein [Alphaproteobacteria bacterium]